MWQNFHTKRGTEQQKTVGMETLNTHFLLTVYILYNSYKANGNKVSSVGIIVFHVVHFYFLQNQDLFQDLSTEM
jgi:hypothetical protein